MTKSMEMMVLQNHWSILAPDQQTISEATTTIVDQVTASAAMEEYEFGKQPGERESR